MRKVEYFKDAIIWQKNKKKSKIITTIFINIKN